uniref:Uncharacterized protein n=1 Tax=Arundo donax TaxID=35708 RepID=A0A0A8YWH7_ARUDO
MIHYHSMLMFIQITHFILHLLSMGKLGSPKYWGFSKE